MKGIVGLGIAMAVVLSSCREKITVMPVKNLAQEFVMGVDVSSLLSVEKSGANFFTSGGKKADAISLLKEGGANCVRIRVWNDPFDENGNSYGGGWCDMENAIQLGSRATRLGMGVLIDFHYSDFWADPNKQTAPKAWAKMSCDEKKSALAKFTSESLARLKEGGVKVTMVQVGNEINNGICGETGDPEVMGLIDAGARAVREFSPDVLVVVHYTDPLSDRYLERKAAMLENFGVDYDVLATSYYPFWHGDAQTLGMTLRKIANLYHKKVMVAETSYPFTDDDGDGFGNVVSTMAANQEFNYPLTPEGQAIAVRDVIEAVASSGRNGLGVFYWEPAWIPANAWKKDAPDAQAIFEKNREGWEKFGSGWASYSARNYDKEVRSQVNGGTWDNQALFGFDGRALESINVFKYARTGSKGRRKILRVENPVLEFAYGKQESLPQTVKVTYNDYDIRDEKISWNQEQAEKVLNKPDFGEYRISGTVEGGATSICTVSVTASNYLVNGGFETGDLSGWEVENPSGRGDPRVDKNSQNAKDGASYLTAWDTDDFEFTVRNTMKNLPEGTFNCFASFQGTGVKNPSGTKFGVVITRKDGTKEESFVDVVIPNEWKKFFRAQIPPVKVDSSVESVAVTATIASHFDKNSGANGTWIVMDDVNFLLAD